MAELARIKKVLQLRTASLSEEAILERGRVEDILDGSNDFTRDELEALIRAMWGLVEDYFEQITIMALRELEERERAAMKEAA